MSWRVEANDGTARAGVLATSRGEIRTPAFMPVGTKGTVKSLHPDEVRALGADVVLANTYHLHFRPGEELVEELGGVHAFSGWAGPILTDSGGFQVFSLRDTITALDDDGVTFRSVYDGADARFTPEGVAEIQRRLGADIAMCLDVCVPAGAPDAELQRAVDTTTRWARRQVDAPRAEGQLRFGITQGATDSELRRRSIDEITALPFDGYALGGLAVGESKQEMLDCVEWAAPALPTTHPRYFMGIGDPEGVLEVIARGHRHVRLRASHPHRTHGICADLVRTAEPPQRRTSRRSAATGRRLRLPRLRAVQPCIHPPPRDATRASRITPAQPA